MRTGNANYYNIEFYKRLVDDVINQKLTLAKVKNLLGPNYEVWYRFYIEAKQLSMLKKSFIVSALQKKWVAMIQLRHQIIDKALKMVVNGGFNFFFEKYTLKDGKIVADRNYKPLNVREINALVRTNIINVDAIMRKTGQDKIYEQLKQQEKELTARVIKLQAMSPEKFAIFNILIS